ncbi:MAG TPA: efflux RND transporter permease subunit, partial [Candidatus Eremiobacteraeota bacterium]|nr:efflux RND transporter permease subunit [Candidatus Eremiobacteraeota bacterium]
MWLTDVAIKRPVFITMVFLALIVLGFRSVTLMAVDQYPKIDIPIVTVVTTYPGAGPEEMETLVTKVIEDQVSTVNKLDELTSISRDSVSTVVIRFLLEADLDAATADVRDKVQLAKPQLPDDVEEPQIIKVDLGSMPVLTFGLTSDSMDVRTLKRLVDQVIADRITKLSGVGDVQVSGGETREILVELDQKRLIAYSITIAEIQQALKTGNINIPSGNIKHESKENVIRVFGEFQSVDEIANLRITKRKSNGTITSFVLSDVAKITDGSADREDFTRINRTDSVGLTVRKQSDANTLKVVEIVKKELKNIEKDYPEINFNISDDQSIYIHSSLEEVRTHLFLGGLLAIFIVFLFLHDIRGTFIIASALPTSMISTFIILFAANQTLNMMSLMGLALCTGILIDDSIVVLENIHRHLKMGKEPKVAALEGRSEIGLAAIAITTVDVVVFLPIAFMGGIVGRFFFSFGLTVATATLFSLFVSFTLTPMLASQWFKKETEEKKKESNFYPLVFMRSLWNGFFGAFDYGYNTLDTFYRRVLEVALKVRWLVVLIGIGSLIIVIRFIAPLLGFEFMPNSDQGKVLVRLELPSDVNVDETDRFVKKIEEIVSNKQDFPEIKSVFAQIGVQKGHFGSGNQGSQYAEITLDIGQKHTRKRSDNEIRRAILEKVIDIPYRVTVVTVSGMGGSEAPLQIQITGSKYQMDDILDISYKVTKIVET